MKKLVTAALAAVSLLSAAPAMANFSCRANPSVYLGVDSGGWVAVQVDGVGVQKICNLADDPGVTMQACQGWYSSLLTLRTLGRAGLLYYNPAHPANGGKTACDQFGPWEARIPYFLEML